ncbi:hypothetical protein MFMK1_001592 [Metallumcola ferriviriculae]|uniref:Uncharacterized protein n=1 Tax=Metallumcola ferriviriculae TaxID=3039180 RepID=A0AAU0UKA6_9FIRM|nr:hypothetical protein MFMK1_001592 [Desulfitibacteraceae bacterium MK1]
MSKCSECGLLEDKGDAGYKCFKYGKEIKQADTFLSTDCLYFIQPQYEEGVPIPKQQLLLIKEADLKRKKLQGPV